MSRIGKQPIVIPAGVSVELRDDLLLVKGPQGELMQKIHPKVFLEQKKGEIIIQVKNPEANDDKAFWGLFRSLIYNMIAGVTEGYNKKLQVEGVGYKVALRGNKLVLNVGYSHPIEYEMPPGIKAQVEGGSITLSGIDKQKVGQVAAEIRTFRKPEPYKGKGIRYVDEVVRRKSGKSAAAKSE